MASPKKKDIELWTARFSSRETEAAFQSFVFTRNLRANVGGALLGLFLFLIYVFSDYIDAVNPHQVAAVRLMAVAISAGLMSLLLLQRFRQYNDPIVTAVVTLMGVANNLIIALQPTLDSTYYIGMIQGYILFSLLLRLSFLSMAFVITFTQICFMIAVFSKGETSVAVLQSANVFMVGAISVVGVYFLQRYQREDFLKTETIRLQNSKLSVLLDDVRRDNERKLAAMNMLVHFVKTPLHQINGFSDIVMNSLDCDDDRISIGDGVEGARYIKSATANLTKSVNNLLTYHRLDDLEGSEAFEKISIDDLVYDFSDRIDSDIAVKVAGAAGDLVTEETALKTALACLSDYYNEEGRGVSTLAITLETRKTAVIIKLRDNGAAISDEQFDLEIKPLTKIENYLSSDTSETSMFLRTVARAAELCGGEFSHTSFEDGNEFAIVLPDRTLETMRKDAA